MQMNNNFYCYSKRMNFFLMALKFQYISTSINKNTNKKYWVYEKSADLDLAIELYNSVKHKYN